MDRLKGKVAVITGGNSGVGEATAKLFASEGATVVITARREAALEKVAEEIRAAGGEVYAVATDISKLEDPEKLMDLVMNKYGKVDILVNNAGILEDCKCCIYRRSEGMRRSRLCGIKSCNCWCDEAHSTSFPAGRDSL